jgi:hypothetical protein
LIWTTIINIKVDRTVERLQRDREIKGVKVMEPRQEMIDVTNPYTVWKEPKEMEDNPVLEEAGQGETFLL